MDFLIFLEKLAEASEEGADVQRFKKIRAADVDVNLEVSFSFFFRYIQKVLYFNDLLQNRRRLCVNFVDKLLKFFLHPKLLQQVLLVQFHSKNHCHYH